MASIEPEAINFIGESKQFSREIPNRSASTCVAFKFKSANATTSKRSLRRVKIGRCTEDATAPAPTNPTRTRFINSFDY